ncbi:hypothetical protein COCNU_scaffold005143G000010 [Cocos nucifera]|nr:hypothetical protein [Cocos nucifera]
MAASSLFWPTLRRRLPLSTSAAASTTSSLIMWRCLYEGLDTVEELRWSGTWFWR